MKNVFKWFLIIAIVALFGLSFSTCDYNPDKDSDGSFYMNGEANSSNSYDYRFLNQSNYEVTVTIGKTTKKLNPSSVFATTITHNQSRTTIKYSPTDKVKVNGGGPTVYFQNK
jgi:hypothetical protein